MRWQMEVKYKAPGELVQTRGTIVTVEANDVSGACLAAIIEFQRLAGKRLFRQEYTITNVDIYRTAAHVKNPR